MKNSYAAAYIRVSTEDQTEYSPASQLSKIREYAASHQLSLPENYIYQDEGFSGRNASKRPAFLRMITDARQTPRPFDVVLLWKYSRFARNRQDSIFYKSMLRKECGIEVVSITEPLSDDPASMLIEALLEAMDEYYSINLAQEVRRGMNEKFLRGGVVSIPPFGYQVMDGQFVPDPKTAPVVQRIYKDCIHGIPCRQIAAALNAAGIRTARNRLFDSRAVRYILTNPFYKGLLRRHLGKHPDESFSFSQGLHPPIITAEQFSQAQQYLHLS